MRYFFIDLENVRNEGLEGVLSLTDQDMVYIFYSENAFSMAIPTLESITNSRCLSKFIKTNYIGKNAMDFQIVSLFGATIERCKGGSFYIISKDNGFRSAVSFCESYFADYPIKCGVYPRIITAIAAEGKEAAEPAKEEKNAGTPKKEKNERQNKTEKKTKQHKETQQEKAAPKEESKAQDKIPDKNLGHAQEYDYIFKLLGEYLSEKTIEIYASCIDEGIARSAGRDDLQKYFRESLGDDEGEALFKVVRSDFEKYKQNRPKKTSRPRRRRSRKGGQGNKQKNDTDNNKTV